MNYYISIASSKLEDPTSNVILTGLYQTVKNKNELSKEISNIVVKYKGDWFSISGGLSEYYCDFKILLIDNGMSFDNDKFIKEISSVGDVINNFDCPISDIDYYPIIYIGDEYNLLSEDEIIKINEITGIELKEQSKLIVSSESGAGSFFINVLYGVLGNAAYEVIKLGIQKVIGNSEKIILSKMPYSLIVKKSEELSGIPKKMHILVSMKYENDIWLYKFRAKGKNIFLKINSEMEVVDYSVL